MSRYFPTLPALNPEAPCYCGCGALTISPWRCSNRHCRAVIPVHHCGKIHRRECPECGELHRAPVHPEGAMCWLLKPQGSGQSGYRRARYKVSAFRGADMLSTGFALNTHEAAMMVAAMKQDQYDRGGDRPVYADHIEVEHLDTRAQVYHDFESDGRWHKTVM